MIFNPYRASTATVHIIYTLCCLSVLKYLYILSVHSRSTSLYKREDEHKKPEQTAKKSLKNQFLFLDYCLYVV